MLTAQYWGKQDTRTIEKVMGMSFRIAILSAAVFTALALCVPDLLMRIFTSDEAIIGEGVRYLRIVAFSYILAAFTNVYLNIIRSIERVVIATVVYATSLSVNILLNAVFIFGLLGAPALGAAGAAIGTLCARAVEVIIVIYYAWKKNDVVRIRIKDMLKEDTSGWRRTFPCMRSRCFSMNSPGEQAWQPSLPLWGIWAAHPWQPTL